MEFAIILVLKLIMMFEKIYFSLKLSDQRTGELYHNMNYVNGTICDLTSKPRTVSVQVIIFNCIRVICMERRNGDLMSEYNIILIFCLYMQEDV